MELEKSGCGYSAVAGAFGSPFVEDGLVEGELDPWLNSKALLSRASPTVMILGSAEGAGISPFAGLLSETTPNTAAAST